MEGDGMELALFDFDHTVTTCDTYGRFLRRVATAEQLAQAWWKVGPWLAAYKLNLISAERIRARVTRLTFSDRHSDDIATLATGFSREVLPEVVRPEMLEQIRWHKEQQHTVVIVSGSLDLYLRPWCEPLGLQLICNRLESQGAPDRPLRRWRLWPAQGRAHPTPVRSVALCAHPCLRRQFRRQADAGAGA